MAEIRLRSPVLTSAEVAIALRMCEPGDDADTVAKAVRCVHRLVREAKLKPIRPGREYVFGQIEVERYIEAETAAFTAPTNGASDSKPMAMPLFDTVTPAIDQTAHEKCTLES